MKKSRVYLAAVLVSAALLLAGCPTPKGPPAPTALGAFQKHLTLTITPTAVPTWTPMPAQSPTPAPVPAPESECPGLDLGIFSGIRIDVSGDTTGATEKFPSPVCVGGAGSAGEHVYMFTLTSPSYVDIHLSAGSLDLVGTLGTSCGAADIYCFDNISHNFSLLPAGIYYLTVRGENPGAVGPYAFYIR